jgi:hypothetical protein
MSGDVASSAAWSAGFDLAFRAALVAAMIALLSRGRARSGRAALAIPASLALIVIVDLGSVSVPMLWRATGPRSRLDPPPPIPIARVAAGDPLSRALSLERASFLSNDWVSWRARSLAGNHAAVGRHWEDLMGDGLLSRYPALCSFAVRYVAGNDQVRIDTTLCDRLPVPGTTATVLRLKETLPRAYTVPRVESRDTDEDVIAAVLAPDFAPAAVAYTREREAAGDYPGSRECAIRWVDDSPDHVALETRSPDRAFVVIADAHFPGWRARVDDRPVPLYRVNHLVRGVTVPAGAHRIRMDYEPPGWSAGVVSTRLAMLVAIALAAALVLIGGIGRRATMPRTIAANEPR